MKARSEQSPVVTKLQRLQDAADRKSAAPVQRFELGNLPTNADGLTASQRKLRAMLARVVAEQDYVDNIGERADILQHGDQETAHELRALKIGVSRIMRGKLTDPTADLPAGLPHARPTPF